MYSPELETLDQLLTSDMKLSLIATFYPTIDHCKKRVLGLLREGDVKLLDSDGAEVPQWRWRELFSVSGPQVDIENFRLRITKQGAKKV